MSERFTDTYGHAGAGRGARCRGPLDGDQRHPGGGGSDLGHLGEGRAGATDIISGAGSLQSVELLRLLLRWFLSCSR